MKLHVKYTETYPDTLPEFSIDTNEGELEQEDYDTILSKVTEAVGYYAVASFHTRREGVLETSWDWK